jgi:hypothetical protein
MLVISTRELTQNQQRYFDIAREQRVVIKRKNRFFQIVDLGDNIPEQVPETVPVKAAKKPRKKDETYMTREELYAKIDRGLEDYRQGRYKVLSSPEEVHEFLKAL